MNRKLPTLHPAGRAIAATLALIATPALAEDATVTTSPETVVTPAAEAPAPVVPAPVVIAAQPTAAAAPAPQLTVTVSDPVVAAPAAEPVAAETVAPAATPRAAAATRATTASAPRVTPASAAPDSPIAFDGAAAAADVAAVANAEPVGDTAALAATQDTTDTPVAAADTASSAEASNASLVMLGGGLALALGLGGLLMAGASRRRRAARAGAVVAPRDTVVEPRTEPVRQAPTIAPVAAAASAFAISASNPAPSYASKWNNDGYVNASPAAGVAGRAVPNTPEGRRALIDRLVRARPDRTNPFTSYAARRRRARLIVQSLQQKLAEQPNLDFRRFYDSFGQRKAAMA